MGHLDLNLLNYVINCDSKKDLPKHLYLTCLEQIDRARIPIFIDNRKHYLGYEWLQLLIDGNFESVHYSFSKYADDLV